MNRRDFAKMGAATALTSAWMRPETLHVCESHRVRFYFMLWALEKQAPLERCLEWVSEAGFQGVEPVGEFQKWSPAERRAVMARMRELALVFDAMSGMRAGFAVPDQTETFRTQFSQQMKAAVELECRKIILLSGDRVVGLGDEVQRQTSVSNVKWAAEMAARE